jgi:hypothetical protein
MRHVLPLFVWFTPSFPRFPPVFTAWHAHCFVRNTAAVETAQEKPASRNAQPDESVSNTETQKTNTMKKLVMSLIALSTIAASAFADLGDTIASSEVKYGKGIVAAPMISYIHNGWWIRQTYNANEICVMVEFARLDGKPITDKQYHSIDANNLPPYTLNANSNGWVTEKWDDNDTFRNVTSHVWSNSQEWWQVYGGLMRWGNDKKWYYGRTYVTPNGLAIVKETNRQNNQQEVGNQPKVTSDNPDIRL